MRKALYKPGFKKWLKKTPNYLRTKVNVNKEGLYTIEETPIIRRIDKEKDIIIFYSDIYTKPSDDTWEFSECTEKESKQIKTFEKLSKL